MKVTALLFILALLALTKTFAQSPFKGLEHLFTQPRSYTAVFSSTAPVIDGSISDPAWENASWSESFVDIEGDLRPAPTLLTRMKITWNDTCLFIAAELKDPHVWATLRKHDQVVFYDNDFEVFIDPDNNTHQYYEIEVNALNTIFDLFMPKPYRNGSGAMIPYDTPGMRTAVKIMGTLNNASDTDAGWTVEMSIPFRALSIGNDAHIPQNNERWRINFSRVEWDTEIINGKYVKKRAPNGRTLPEHNWVWSAQGVVNMHYPERWGYLQFVKTNGTAPFVSSYAEKQKEYLWLAYYRQKAYYDKNGRYASTVAALNIPEKTVVADGNSLREDVPLEIIRMEATSRQFTVTIGPGDQLWSINEEGLIQAVKSLK